MLTVFSPNSSRRLRARKVSSLVQPKSSYQTSLQRFKLVWTACWSLAWDCGKESCPPPTCKRDMPELMDTHAYNRDIASALAGIS